MGKGLKGEIQDLRNERPISLHAASTEGDSRMERRVNRYIQRNLGEVIAKGKQSRSEKKEIRKNAEEVISMDEWRWVSRKRKLKMVIDNELIENAPMVDLTEGRENFEQHYSNVHYSYATTAKKNHDKFNEVVQEGVQQEVIIKHIGDVVEDAVKKNRWQRIDDVVAEQGDGINEDEMEAILHESSEEEWLDAEDSDYVKSFEYKGLVANPFKPPMSP